ncbi:galacturan 1,4-alpha-galacturonidase B [Ilyonectria robusta]|uniref:galacturan 1,4-alpha-galacturonidase B n=1 Tax=Ilyonectria robusta TaxID=1079257 RepID=UPI001E8EE353|nr:galacturan 1,4-alpha-galacturonidase B [Ilyonectria robusta]KAH8714752.1 galacturan 1,4-alpha-galacturonidase B [Ilyonectria robusta]
MQRPCLILLFCAVLQCVGATLDLGYDQLDSLALRDERSPHQKTCVVNAGGSNDTDDAPAVRKAFKKCGHGGRVVFKPTTYYINTVLNVSGLENVDIDILGELSWGTNITYWLNNSLPVGYQNQSTAFVLGGNNVRINGYNRGTFNGNGDEWYKFIRSQPNTSNYPGRPHAITFNGLTNSVVRGLRFLRSQMWTMSIIHSHYVEFDDIFINNTGNIYQSSNTDGADTIRSSHIKMNNWTVYNGDDSISLKANSTDITITNSRFYNGLGIAIGSIGQYYGETETIERFHGSNLEFNNTLHAFYFKTWTADRNGYPPNGGGGGKGYAEDLVMENLKATGLRGGAVTISQCTRFSGAPGSGNCTNSEFQIRNISVDGLIGTTKDSRVASFQCSAVKPCTNLALFNIDLKLASGVEADRYLCGNVVDPRGFNCTGPPCVGGSATGGC